MIHAWLMTLFVKSIDEPQTVAATCNCKCKAESAEYMGIEQVVSLMLTFLNGG